MHATISSRLTTALAAAALSLTLASCAGTPGTVASAPTQGTNADPSEEASDGSPAPADDGTVAFGQSYRWDDGLQVTISTPKPYKPSRWAAAKKSKNYLVMTVTVLNGTSATYEPALFNLSAQSGDAESEQVFDSGNGVGGSPNTKLLKGRQAKWKVAFAVKNPKDLVVEVTPDFEHDPVIYQLG